MSLRSYLETHFLDKASFSTLAQVSQQRLDQLIEIGAVPAATYTCNGASITSAVFGQIETDENIYGEYFRPECIRWVQLAHHASAGEERASVESLLISELRDALSAMGIRNHSEIEEKIAEYLPSFQDGTFGLCVADPSSGIGIAKKELLQEQLTTITENGLRAEPQGISKSDLLKLIDEYAAAAMPFSPAEYGRSSRKRLVDDLRPRVSKA